MGFNIFASSKGGMVYSLEFLEAVAAGQIPGFSLYNQFGRSNALSTTKRVVWDGGNETYHYTDPASPEGYRLSCSDNTATQNIAVKTVDDDWATTVATHTLTGQTPVNIGSYIRAYDMRCIGPGRDIVPGTTYISGSGAISGGAPGTITMIRGMILTPNNVSLMSIFPVPAVRTAYVLGFWASIHQASGLSAISADVELWVSGTGMPFQLERSVGGINYGGNPFVAPYVPPLPIPAKSDIELRGVCSAAMDLGAGFSVLLVDD